MKGAGQMETASRLSVQVKKLTAYAVVTASGAVEGGTRPVLIHHLNKALQMTRVAVIMDMSAVEYCDFSGLSAIAHTFRQAKPPAPSLVLVDPTDRLKRVMSATALEPVYAHADLESAVRWLETGSLSRPDRAAAEGDHHGGQRKRRG
jgi:anti-sigma B factor antagonist